eukprot:CAMPEP_0182800392 /NCGR_PEP_ID=MMETSP0006_2-20121128/2387_1 /TAXON_ID=97485 /ORGANISM="Prymnesium parvum, Strain Texoma1" /LENGTH=89 /DNA_ID=CAMNT_0024925629 /DNA_START=68 /DNA_END=333 /DNA_ORIENTATION=+
MPAQTYEEVVRIIKSLSNVKGIRLRVKATIFGVEWASQQSQETFVGVVDRWQSKNEVLYVKWEGWNQNRQCPLSSLNTDTNGDSLESSR